MRTLQLLILLLIFSTNTRKIIPDNPPLPHSPIIKDFLSLRIKKRTLSGDHKTGVLTHYLRGPIYHALRAKLESLSLTDKEIYDILDGTTHVITTYLQFIYHADSTPVFINFKASSYAKSKVIEEVDAVLLPGGNMKLPKRYADDDGRTTNKIDREEPGEYLSAVEDLIRKIRTQNEKLELRGQKKINLLGICLGFGAIMFTDSGYELEFTEVKNRKFMNDEIFFAKKYRELREIKRGRIRKLSDNKRVIADLFTHKEKKELREKKIIFFNHQKAFDVKQFNKAPNLKAKYNIVATYKYSENEDEEEDKKNKTGVAIIESKKEPFYGVQFHPERMSFETHDNFSSKYSAFQRSINQKFSKLLNPECKEQEEGEEETNGYIVNTRKVRKIGDHYYLDVPDVAKYGLVTLVSTNRNIEKFTRLVATAI